MPLPRPQHPIYATTPGEIAKQLCQFGDRRAAIGDQRVQIAKQLCQFAKQLCQFSDRRAVFNDQQAQHTKQLCQFAFRDRVPGVCPHNVASSSRHTVSLEAAT